MPLDWPSSKRVQVDVSLYNFPVVCAISTSRPVGANPQLYACGREPSRVPIRKSKAPLRVFVTLSHVASYCMSVSSLALIVLRA